MKNRIKISSKILLLFIVFACISSCRKKDTKEVLSQEIETVYAVNTYIVSVGNLDEYLEFGGDVVSAASVSIMPDVTGKISRKLVNIGEMVKKEQIIAYVDASRPGMTYSESPVKAPIAGRIIAFTPSVGTAVSQAQPIAEIAKTDELEILVNVAERFISRIQQGQKATVSFDAYPNTSFSARVFEVSPVLDSISRTMSIKLKFEKLNSQVKVGMYARVKLITDTVKDIVIVPEKALVTRQETSYLFVINSEKTEEVKYQTVRLQPVTEGISVDGNTEIMTGIKAGEQIVVKGQSLLNDGSKVNVISISEKF